MNIKGELNAVGRRAFFWNMVGSMTNAVSTMILTIVATRVAGVEEGGVLGLAFGLCQIFSVLAGYEVRAYQSTDLKERFRFCDYFGFRILTCLFVAAACAWYVFGLKYTGSKASVVYAVCVFKILDAFSDVFQGFFQQHGYLEYAGQALALRVIMAGLAYSLTLIFTHNPVLAAWMMPAVSALCIILFDISRMGRFKERIKPKFEPIACGRILITCFPLFISGFMVMCTLNITRLEVDSQAPWLQGYWTPIYMPAFAINLLSIFAFRPMMTTLRFDWENNKFEPFFKLLVLLIGWIIGCMLCALIGGYWFGIPILEVVYGLSLAEYKTALLIILVGGGFNALAGLFQCVITIIRAQQFLVLGDGVTFLAAMIITPLFVRNGLLTGAAAAYLCSMLIRSTAFGVIILGKCRATVRHR